MRQTGDDDLGLVMGKWKKGSQLALDLSKDFNLYLYYFVGVDLGTIIHVWTAEDSVKKLVLSFSLWGSSCL